jgi:molybdopterin converting factor subunit 1
MRLRILYFAAVRDLTGTDEETLDVPARTTIGELARLLQERTRELEGRLGAVRFARNEQFASAGDELAEGDVIAVIPPVAGG